MKTLAVVLSCLSCIALLVVDLRSDGDALLSNKEMSRIFGAQCKECTETTEYCRPYYYQAAMNDCEWYGCMGNEGGCESDLTFARRWSDNTWNRAVLNTAVAGNYLATVNDEDGKLCSTAIYCVTAFYHPDLGCIAPFTTGPPPNYQTIQKGQCALQFPSDYGCYECFDGGDVPGAENIEWKYDQDCVECDD